MDFDVQTKILKIPTLIIGVGFCIYKKNAFCRSENGHKNSYTKVLPTVAMTNINREVKKKQIFNLCSEQVAILL